MYIHTCSLSVALSGYCEGKVKICHSPLNVNNTVLPPTIQLDAIDLIHWSTMCVHLSMLCILSFILLLPLCLSSSMVSGRRTGGDSVAETSLETIPSTPVGSVEPSLPPLVDSAAAGIYNYTHTITAYDV